MAPVVRSSRLIIPFLCIFALQFIVFCHADVPNADSSCRLDRNYTENSQYQTNLKLLLSSLRNQSSFTGFCNYTVGSSPDKVFGLFLCRGDIKNIACQECVVDASEKIVKDCPNQKEAIIYYEECMVRYSDRWIFSIKEELPQLTRLTSGKVPNEARFQLLLANKLEELIFSACFGPPSATPRYFAKGQETIAGSGLKPYNVSFLVRLTPDLTPEDCRKCLGVARDDILTCCDTDTKAAVFMPSCHMRFDKFFERPPPPPPSSDSSFSRSQHSNWLNREVILRAVFPIVILVALRLQNAE